MFLSPFVELESAPHLTKLVATSSQTLNLGWTAPVTNNYTGEIFYCQICYQKSDTSGNSSRSPISVGSKLTQVEIRGLHPYQEYQVQV